MRSHLDRFCPVCNGLEPFVCPCPCCGHALDDQGRLWDWVGPYSPYMPIAELAELYADRDGFGAGACLHVATCPACGTVQRVAIAELPMPALSGKAPAPPAHARAFPSRAREEDPFPLSPFSPSDAFTPPKTENRPAAQKELPLS